MARLGQKLMPFEMSAGSAINSTSEGSTYQKMLCARLATLAASPVSPYSQIKANIDVNGSDASTAPIALERLPDQVCQMVQDWFVAHLAVKDKAAQDRLLYETLKPVVSG